MLGRSPRVIVASLAAAALALLATGCSDDDDDADAPENPLVAAADATIAAETGAFRLSATITGLEGTDGPVDVTAEGSYSFPDRLVAGEADLSGLFAALRDSLGLPGIVDNLFDDPVDLVSDGEFLYLDFPLLAATAGGGDWVKVDTGAIAGGSFTIASDPSLIVRLLGGAEDMPESESGRYSGTITVERAIANAPEEERDRLEAAVEGLGIDADGRTDPIPFAAVVDDDGRIESAEVTLGSGSSAAADIRLEFSDFGADVDIEVPEDAVDVTDSLSGLGG